MVYLLKVTFVWTLFLLLFEALYKSNGKFTINRLYLLLSIAAGLLLPFIPLPAHVPTATLTAQVLSPLIPGTIKEVKPAAITIATASAIGGNSTINIWLILRFIYGIGIAFLVTKTLLESRRIIRLVLHHPHQMMAGRKVIITGKQHTPYSFMGWIFIGELNAYQPAELEYIVRHEAAHNHKKHWFDLLLLQLACIMLWFHPLIWRYRYLLQLQHEYEADHLAAQNNAYAYGHFLLQQTLLNAVPSLAHSFYFSPIKNRIKMLTKKHHQRPGTWKYLLVIPALLGCTLLMAKAMANAGRIRQGNVTTYNGSTFKWRKTDTLYYDAIAKIAQRTPSVQKEKRQIIYEMNGEPVYQNEYLKTPATFGKNEMAYTDYLKKEFVALRKNLPDSLTSVSVVNMVINKEGKVVYYDLRAIWPMNHDKPRIEWHPYGDQEPVLNSIMDKIIRNAPDWKPAAINGKPVNSIINIGGGC